jgi:hypothetical protein
VNQISGAIHSVKKSEGGTFSMQTQEERLTMLEQSFGTMQREIGTSIRALNENGTILLGLFQTQLQATRQTGFSVEMMKIRMDQLETKFDAHTALLNEHTRMLNVHTKVLDDHTGLLNEHTRVLNKHTIILGEHTGILNAHTAILSEHTTRFDRLETMLTQVLARLPEKS